MSIRLQRQPARFDLTVGPHELRGIEMGHARELRDALDALIITETSGSETVIAMTCLHFHERRDAINISRAAGPSACRLVAMSLVKEFFPVLGDKAIAGMFERERSISSYARQWLRDREACDKRFALSITQLRGAITRQLDQTNPRP